MKPSTTHKLKKAMTLAEYIEQLSPLGYEIQDNRILGMPITISSQPIEWVTISRCEKPDLFGYFLLSNSGGRLPVALAKRYAKQLLEKAEICETLNRLIAEETVNQPQG